MQKIARLNSRRRLATEVAKTAEPTFVNKKLHITDLTEQSTNYYDHVEFLYKDLKRFETNMIPPLVAAAVKKVELERPDSNLKHRLLMTAGMKPARDVLLHEHEVKIAAHLESEVYTANHFSMLRLVARMSKRVCGLIEQSIKYSHHQDGTKRRKKMRPGSRVPAPSLFALKDINWAESESEKRSQLMLRDHSDRKGADICGKQYALDRAIFDSLKQTSRSGGMATAGTEEEPHLICLSGDGAGLSARGGAPRRMASGRLPLARGRRDVRQALHLSSDARSLLEGRGVHECSERQLPKKVHAPEAPCVGIRGQSPTTPAHQNPAPRRWAGLPGASLRPLEAPQTRSTNPPFTSAHTLSSDNIL